MNQVTEKKTALILQIRKMKRALVKKYGPHMRKRWERE